MWPSHCQKMRLLFRIVKMGSRGHRRPCHRDQVTARWEGAIHSYQEMMSKKGSWRDMVGTSAERPLTEQLMLAARQDPPGDSTASTAHLCWLRQPAAPGRPQASPAPAPAPEAHCTLCSAPQEPRLHPALTAGCGPQGVPADLAGPPGAAAGGGTYPPSRRWRPRAGRHGTGTAKPTGRAKGACQAAAIRGVDCAWRRTSLETHKALSHNACLHGPQAGMIRCNA